MALKYNINPSSNRLEKLEAAQNGTVNDLVEMLNKHQIALMVRPTGFGKTHLMIELAKREAYEKVLYLYPIDVIKQSIYESYHKESTHSDIKFAATEDEHLSNPALPFIEFCSYSKMLEDYTHAYKYVGKTPWDKMSQLEKETALNKWATMSAEGKEKLRSIFIKERFEHVELLILDEAHMCGACGFLKYWDTIHTLTSKGLKSNRLHVLGATATQLRTASDIDIEKEVFYYERGGKATSAAIDAFTIEDCWRFGILQRPFYVKAILNKDAERESILKKLKGLAADKEDFDAQEAADNIDDLMSYIKRPNQIMESAVRAVNNDALNESEYMRFLVFYQNASELLASHLDITAAIKQAFINKEYGYTNINDYYITSNIPELIDNNIPISKVDALGARDAEVANSEDFCARNIDVIHSIDMLNMGYHVGKVTGVIIKRATGSEIVYYQQIGRCISVAANNKPLIIDFANAAAELQDRALSDDREQALQNVKQFIQGCDTDEIQTEAVDKLYKYIGICFDTEELSDDFIKFWYFDRSAPIYFIHAISKSLGKKGSPITLLRSLISICKAARQKLTLDSEYIEGNPRLSKEVQKFVTNDKEYLKRAQKLKNI